MKSEYRRNCYRTTYKQPTYTQHYKHKNIYNPIITTDTQRKLFTYIILCIMVENIDFYRTNYDVITKLSLFYHP